MGKKKEEILEGQLTKKHWFIMSENTETLPRLRRNDIVSGFTPMEAFEAHMKNFPTNFIYAMNPL